MEEDSAPAISGEEQRESDAGFGMDTLLSPKAPWGGRKMIGKAGASQGGLPGEQVGTTPTPCLISKHPFPRPSSEALPRSSAVRLAIQQVQPPEDPAMTMNCVVSIDSCHAPIARRMGLFTVAALRLSVLLSVRNRVRHKKAPSERGGRWVVLAY